jgi:MoaA/NifB/PqqE/SkfB family radical SAM enzyme
MNDFVPISLERVIPLHNAELMRFDSGIVLTTPPAQWAYAAEVEFELPDIAAIETVVRVQLNIKSGSLGIGWLRADGANWITRGSATMPSTQEVNLRVPAGTAGGKLVFDNWSEGDRPAVAVIREIAVTSATTGASADEFFRFGCEAEQRDDRALALSHYRSALRIDPSHVESVAGLGRLQFLDPPQPFFNEMRRRAPIDVCEVHIQVRNPCNYRCFYCVAAGSNNVPVQRLKLDRIAQIYTDINSRLIVTSLECGGGEPTVHPQLPELLRICVSHGAVSFPTNNSQDPKRWLPKETARRISLRAALHPEGEDEVDRFLEYARYLVDAGVDFHTQYIAHPTRMQKIPEYMELFRSNGIAFSPIAFIGQYEGKPYPYSYSNEEKELLGLNVQSSFWGAKIGPHINKFRNFRGIPCISGARQIYVLADGTLRRCMYDSERVLERPLDRAEPCGVSNCGCGMFLEKLNFTEDIGFHNYFGSRVGLDPFPTDWMDELARSLGYRGANEAMAAEGVRIYDSLMSAYGKEEFPES